MIPIISIVAFSGTGKTTFFEKLIPELKKLGLRVAVFKHGPSYFEIDKKGKDTYRMTEAGADITGIISDTKSVIMENRSREVIDILNMVTDVDLILTEGFKKESWPKIMLHRSATGKPLPLDPKEVLAVVSDIPVEGARHFFNLNDADGVARFIYDEIK